MSPKGSKSFKATENVSTSPQRYPIHLLNRVHLIFKYSTFYSSIA